MRTEAKNSKCNVERIICDMLDVPVGELYAGKGNIPVKRAMARNLCLYMLHDRFSVFYKELAVLTGMTTRSVMRCVRKARIYSGMDKEYIRCYSILAEKLKIRDCRL